MNTHHQYETGQHVFVIDLALVGTIIDVEHVDDYVLDDPSFESPKRASFRVSVGGDIVWRKATELRSIPDDVAKCVVPSR